MANNIWLEEQWFHVARMAVPSRIILQVHWDNAMQESFWPTLKAEFYDRRGRKTRAESKAKVAWWIEDFYNRHRLHSKVGMLPPVEFEKVMRAGGAGSGS